MPWITDGEATIQVDDSQLSVFLLRKNSDGQQVFVETSAPEQEPIPANTGRTPPEKLLRMQREDSITFCDPQQREVLEAAGWQRADKTPAAVSADAPAGPFSPEVTEVTANPLRDVLQGLSVDDASFWNADGQVNISALRTLVADVTRDQVNEAWPGFTRAALQDE